MYKVDKTMSKQQLSSVMKPRGLDQGDNDAALKTRVNGDKQSRPWREPPLVPYRVYTVSAPTPILHHSEAATRRHKASSDKDPRLP